MPSVPIRAVVPVGVDDMASERPRLIRLPVNEEGQEGVESSRVERLQLQLRGVQQLFLYLQKEEVSRDWKLLDLWLMR